jgi:exosome complex RNA-binding protein Rrp42 (RNase PH superfamily)
LQTDGNAIDVCSFATYNALKCTHVPKTEVFVGESGRPEDFEVSGEIIDAVLFEPASLPLCVTVTKVHSCFDSCSVCSLNLSIDQSMMTTVTMTMTTDFMY